MENKSLVTAGDVTGPGWSRARLGTPVDMGEVHADMQDQAMGLELQAIELESELEWAEAQGRTADARALRRQLVIVLMELGVVSDRIVA
jgi:hypothetical protein